MDIALYFVHFLILFIFYEGFSFVYFWIFSILFFHHKSDKLGELLVRNTSKLFKFMQLAAIGRARDCPQFVALYNVYLCEANQELVIYGLFVK